MTCSPAFAGKQGNNVLFSIQTAAFSCLLAKDLVVQSSRGIYAQANFHTIPNQGFVPPYSTVQIRSIPLTGQYVCIWFIRTNTKPGKKEKLEMQHNYLLHPNGYYPNGYSQLASGKPFPIRAEGHFTAVTSSLERPVTDFYEDSFDT